MMRLTTLMSPKVVADRAMSAQEVREAINWIDAPHTRYHAGYDHINDIPIRIRAEASNYLRLRGRQLLGYDDEPFCEAGRQLSAFADGVFRITDDGHGDYGDGHTVPVMGAVFQYLRHLRGEHLREQALPQLKTELKQIEEEIARAPLPPITARLFSPAAREMSRTIKQITRVR